MPFAHAMKERGARITQSADPDAFISGKNYVLAIAVDAYRDWPALNNAVRDVREMLQTLVEHYQFDLGAITTLYDEQATERAIYEAIRELKQQIRPQDNLIVLYSGHGHYDPEFEEGFWIPVDGGRDTEASYISNANIIRRINAIDSHHTLMIVDSCFSGTLLTQKRAAVGHEKFRSRRVLASGRAETVDDGQPGKHSPFANAVITYLKKNSQQTIDASSLIQYVKEDVTAKARQTPVDGRLQNSEDENGEFIFRRKSGLISNEDQAPLPYDSRPVQDRTYSPTMAQEKTFPAAVDPAPAKKSRGGFVKGLIYGGLGILALIIYLLVQLVAWVNSSSPTVENQTQDPAWSIEQLIGVWRVEEASHSENMTKEQVNPYIYADYAFQTDSILTIFDEHYSGTFTFSVSNNLLFLKRYPPKPDDVILQARVIEVHYRRLRLWLEFPTAAGEYIGRIELGMSRVE